MTAGTTCVNFTAGSASNIFTEQITGGTGRFKNASGTLTAVVPASYPILFDSTGQPVLIGRTGSRVRLTPIRMVGPS